MATGDLSADQQRFWQQLIDATHNDGIVVAAWIGCESGWSKTKPDHNYLNVGPGKVYPDVDTAARDTSAEINKMGLGSLGTDYAAVADKIGASKWGTSASCLHNTFNSFPGISTGGAASKLPGVPNVLDPFGWVSSLVGGLGEIFLTLVLTGLFTAAGLALVGLGVNRLTSVGAGERVEQTTRLATNAATVAAIA